MKNRNASLTLLKGILTFMVLSVFSVNGIAQNSALLRVVVLSEEDGNPLIGANVVLLTDIKKQDDMLYCITNIDGYCEIRNIPALKEFTLQISFLGLKTHEEIIRFNRNERKVLEIKLEPTVSNIDEISIVDRPINTVGEAGIQHVKTIDIARIPTPGSDGDLVSYLQTMPGVVTTGDRGGDLYIRGGAPDQNLILLDNIPVVKPFHISNLFSAFPATSINNVDMFAGGFGAEFSGATSAVIDISMREGNMVNYEGSASFSPYLVSFSAEGPVKKNSHSIYFSGRHSTIQTFGSALSGKHISQQFYDLIGKYSLRENNISCSFTGLHTSDKGEIVPARKTFQRWTNTMIGGRCFGYDPVFEHPFEVTAGYSNFNNSEGNTEETEVFSAVYQFVMKLDLQEEFLNNRVNYGLGFNFPLYKTHLNERFRTERSFKRDLAIFNVYSNLEWVLSEKLTVLPGINFQYTFQTPISFEPRLRISFIPDQAGQQEISLAAGRYVQHVSGINDGRDVGTVFTVYKPLGRHGPASNALHGILAYQFNGNIFSFNVEGFVKKHNNLGVSKWEPEVGIEFETTLASGFTYGFDTQMEFNFQNIYTSVRYGYSNVKYEAMSGDLGAWILEPVFSYSPAHDQRHKLNTVFTYNLFEFTLSTRWEFGTGRPYTQIFGFDTSVQVPYQNPIQHPGYARILYSRLFGERLPTYHRLDIALERNFKLRDNLELTSEIGVINAYNRNNIYNFDVFILQRVDQTPLFPYVSVKLSFL